jgi:hypothetical protein
VNEALAELAPSLTSTVTTPTARFVLAGVVNVTFWPETEIEEGEAATESTVTDGLFGVNPVIVAITVVPPATLPELTSSVTVPEPVIGAGEGRALAELAAVPIVNVERAARRRGKRTVETPNRNGFAYKISTADENGTDSQLPQRATAKNL